MGFTLLELMVALALFLILSGATFSLFSSHAPYFNRQQNLAGVNIQLQSALTQMQLDVVNGGAGYYPGSFIPSFPIGMTVSNQNPASACNNPTIYTYGATCFDTLSILTMNPNVPPAHPTDSTGLAQPSVNCSFTYNGTFYIQPYSGMTPAQTAAYFNRNDQLILVTQPNATSMGQGQTAGSLYNTLVLTSAPTTGPNYVQLSFTASNNNGTNCNSSPCVFPPGDARDPLNITTNAGNPSYLGTKFCSQDWVMKLQPTTYSVSVANPTDPTLQRTNNNVTSNVAEQVIGFKIGVTVLNDPNVHNYHFKPSDYNYNYSLIQSVRVMLIGRTNPNPDPTYTFRNAFDGGPYEVVGDTVVINPRNLSMDAEN